MATPENNLRAQYVYKAKLAEKAERYKDMATYMDNLVLTTAASRGELTVEERNLLSAAYNHVTGSLRAAWRTASSIEQKEGVGRNKNNDDAFALVTGYRSQVASELSDVCARLLKLLDDTLVPTAVANESKVFYLKMKGDYHRYLAEFKSGDERKSAVDDAVNAYETALETAALTDLSPAHPSRLGVALNYSVLYYDILNDVDTACSMAKQAFEEAAPELDKLGEKSYKDDSNLIMKLLKENFTLWKSDDH